MIHIKKTKKTYNLRDFYSVNPRIQRVCPRFCGLMLNIACTYPRTHHTVLIVAALILRVLCHFGFGSSIYISPLSVSISWYLVVSKRSVCSRKLKSVGVNFRGISGQSASKKPSHPTRILVNCQSGLAAICHIGNVFSINKPIKIVNY